MAKPTASDSGTNNCRAAPAMKNDGTKTARMHIIASRRGTAVLRDASSTARARDTPSSQCVWMLSISTVASSTSTPTASARPPSVMMLMVWPAAQSQTTAASNANGMVGDHDQGAAPVAQEQQHHQSGERAPRQALADQAVDGVDHVRRLVEDKIDLHVRSDRVGHRAHLRQGSFDAIGSRRAWRRRRAW